MPIFLPISISMPIFFLIFMPMFMTIQTPQSKVSMDPEISTILYSLGYNTSTEGDPKGPSIKTLLLYNQYILSHSGVEMQMRERSEQRIFIGPYGTTYHIYMSTPLCV